jgi:hypothetical protein
MNNIPVGGGSSETSLHRHDYHHYHHLGRDAGHSPPSTAEVVNEWELYFLFPKAPPWRIAGLLYFTLLYFIIIIKKTETERCN